MLFCDQFWDQFLGLVWDALGRILGGSGGDLGEFWEALYIKKLPINRPCGRYVIIMVRDPMGGVHSLEVRVTIRSQLALDVSA